MPDKTAHLEIFSAVGHALRVEFSWQGDRFAHSVAVHTASGTEVLMRSCEGHEGDVWPGSPPLQQLSVEKQADGQTALFLVGMAGRSHWSLSVVPDPARRAVVFDAACRADHAPLRLGSHYAIHPRDAAKARQVLGEARELVTPPRWAAPVRSTVFAPERRFVPGCRMAVLSTDHAYLLLSADVIPDELPGSIVRANDQLVIGPSTRVAAPWPATLRWRYRIGWFDPPP